MPTPPFVPVRGLQAAAGRLLIILVAFGTAAAAGIATAAQVTLSNLAQTYSGSQKSVTVTTVPAGLTCTVTYAGSTTAPTNAGSYAVVATVTTPGETGSATGTLVIAKASQTITFANLPTGKVYGDAPFAIAPTVNSGLPLILQSSDPSVALVDEDGTVNIVGAGFTTIIASQSGNTNYNQTWVAKPITVGMSSAPMPTGVTTTTYDGTAKPLPTNNLPAGEATQITYRTQGISDPTPATPDVVFQNDVDTLPLSYSSRGYAVGNIWSAGKYIQLSGTARKAVSCDVTLVTYAKYDTTSPYGYMGSSWVTAHPELVVFPKPGISIPGDSGGYYHPLTLAIHEYNPTDKTWKFLMEQTIDAFIPWRPLKQANGSNYPYSGYAFKVNFSFPDGVVLPSKVWVSLSFNTQSTGFSPIGSSGPYNDLNVPAVNTTTTNDLLSGNSYIYNNWRWQPLSGTAGPMMRLRAVPTNATLTAPTNAGIYDVSSRVTAQGLGTSSTSTLTINKAPLGITLGNLAQARDGAPKYASVTTVPAGIATTTTYAGSTDGPSALGSYPVSSVSANPNYEGQANGTLQIGDSFTSWQNASFQASGLPPEKTTDTADPDGDGLTNFLEYAFNLPPTAGNPGPISGLGVEGSSMSLTYRKNLHALDLQYAIEATTNLADPLSWAEVTPSQESTISDDGNTREIRATVTVPDNQPRYFLRVKARR